METFVNLEAGEVVNALADTQVVVVSEKLCMAQTLKEESDLTQKKTRGDMEANAPVDALSDTLGKEKGETQDRTLSDMEAMTLVEPLANTLTHGGRESNPTQA